ncbi:MAG: amidohydrolase family protein [Candidatus Hermodarchaeota archaeon]
MKENRSSDGEFLIKEGKIIDGTGNPWYRGDILVENGKIKEISHKVSSKSVDIIIDASRFIVSPGFIDIHTHSDLTVLFSRGENVISQGVTTHVVGNCGFSMTPINPARPMDDEASEQMKSMLSMMDTQFEFHTLKDYLEGLENKGIPINIIPLIGHSTLRMYTLGLENRPPTENEMKEMKEVLEEEIKMGAFGMSTGLDYPPGSFAKTDEIIELCKVVKKFDGIYTTHFRGFPGGLIKATKEAIKIAKTGISVEINHFKPFGFWPGDIKKAYEYVEKARDTNLDITFDVFPHASNSTFLFVLVPPWVYLSDNKINIPGAMDILTKSKTDESLKEKIYKDMDLIAKSFLKINNLEDWKKVYINAPGSREYNGKTVYRNALERGENPRQVIIDVLIEQEGSVGGTYLSMTEEENIITITHPLTMFASDGRIIPESDPNYFPNPYANGCFTQVLGKYVREKKLLTLEDAVRRMTSYPAQKLGLRDRGLLREGNWADITIFDFDTIIDKATYENPRLYSEGVEYVFVNGVLALDKGNFTGSLSGAPIRKI